MAHRNETLGANVFILEKDPTTGYASIVRTYGVPTTDASQYAPGCVAVDTLNYQTYINRGTAAAPKWVAQLGKYFTTVTSTNATSAVNIFDANGAPCALTLTSVVSIAKDTTASNITVQQAANTVATIAKGVTAGVPVGASSLSNTTYAAGDVATVLSSGSGNSYVVITWQLA